MTSPQPKIPSQTEIDEFRQAAGRGDKAAAEAFLGAYPDAVDSMSSYGDTALVIAAQSGQKEMVELLLQKGATPDLPDRGGWTPFMWAALGRSDIAELLWQKTASPAAKARRATHRAEQEAKKAMLPSDAEIHDYIEAAAKGNAAAVVEFLDRHPALIDQVRDGATALYMAAFRGQTAVVALLLERGANIEMGNNAGNTPLMAAAGEGRLETAELLWSKGASLNTRNHKNHTPLMWAALTGKAGAVRFFLEKGVPLDDVDRRGQDALALARLNRREETAELLEQWPEILRRREEEQRARKLAEELERQKKEMTESQLKKIKDQRSPQSPFKKDPP